MKAIRIWAIVAVLGISAGVAATDETDRIPMPSDVFYYRPAATAFGPEAIWNNPAGLSRSKIAGFELMADYGAGDFAENWGGVVYRDGSATAFRHVNNPDGTDYEEWLTGAGLSLSPTLNFGLSYRYFRKGPGLYNKRHFWNIGMGTQRLGSFALGATFSNLNRGEVDGKRTAVEERLSLGYRPLGPSLTLSADMLLTSHDNLSAADFVYHLECVPKAGLYLNGLIDSDGNYEIGVRANLLKYFIGSQSHFNDRHHNERTTVYLGASNMQQASLVGKRGRRLDLAVTGTTSENPPQPVFGNRNTSFLTLIATLYRAADDPSISALKLDLGRLTLGMGQAQELREAMIHFRTGGKRIICHLSTPNNLGYFVASAADTILIPPVSELQLVGLRAELTFWAGTLEKLGAKVELLRIGDYKSAAESLTREASTEENRAQTNRLLDDLYEQFVTGIAEGRGLSTDSVRRIIDSGPFTSAEAIRYGLVDGLSYRDQVCKDYFQNQTGVSFKRYQTDTLINDSWQPAPVIAIVVADGEILPDGGGSDWTDKPSDIRPADMARVFERVLSDPRIRGVVLRINSPGGWALAGEEIHRGETVAMEAKPMVVSMANMAASGGYYIATPARQIFVDPATITGSIGIYGGKADLSGLYEKIRLGKELYTRGRYAGMLTQTRPFTDDERDKYFSHLKAFYDHFVDLVATSRGLTTDSVDALGRGQVWTGREAIACGLADQVGGVQQAVEYLAAEMDLDHYSVEIYPQKRPWFLFPGISLWKSVMAVLTGNDNSPEATQLSLPLFEEGSLIARIPYDLSVE
jgi:protease IV